MQLISSQQQNIHFVLTLGSSHISLVAARIDSIEDNYLPHNNFMSQIQILGAARLSNYGAFKSGVVLSIDSLSNAIIEVIDEVERQTGLQINKAIICTPCINADFDNYIANYKVHNSEIQQADIKNMYNNTHALKAPTNFEYIHAIHGLYTVDGKTDIFNPVGMSGSSIECCFHRIFLPKSDLYNISSACHQAGISVQRFVYEPLASAEGSLTQDEKELGCISISIGTYLTHVAVYSNKIPIFTKEFNLGSYNITKDLAIGLKTTQADAERIKKEHGRALYNNKHDVLEKIAVCGIADFENHAMTRQDVINIIAPRVNEILKTVYLELEKLQLLEKATKGIVLSGGGALLNGISIAAEKIYNINSRIGYPLNISGSIEGLKSPIWTASIGAFSKLFNFQFEQDFSNNYNFKKKYSVIDYMNKIWKQLNAAFIAKS